MHLQPSTVVGPPPAPTLTNSTTGASSPLISPTLSPGASVQSSQPPPQRASFGNHHSSHSNYFQQQHGQQNFPPLHHSHHPPQQHQASHTRHVNNQQHIQQHHGHHQHVQHHHQITTPATTAQSQTHQQQQQKVHAQNISSPTSGTSYQHSHKHTLQGHHNHHSTGLAHSQSHNQSSATLQQQSLMHNNNQQHSHHNQHKNNSSSASRLHIGTSTIPPQSQSLSSSSQHQPIPPINSPPIGSAMSSQIPLPHGGGLSSSTFSALQSHQTSGTATTSSGSRAFEFVELLRREIENMCQDCQNHLLQQDELEKRVHGFVSEISSLYCQISELEKNQKYYRASLEEEVRCLRRENTRLLSERQTQPPPALCCPGSSASNEGQNGFSTTSEAQTYLNQTPQTAPAAGPSSSSQASSFESTRDEHRSTHHGISELVASSRKRSHTHQSQYPSNHSQSSSSGNILSPLPVVTGSNFGLKNQYSSNMNGPNVYQPNHYAGPNLEVEPAGENCRNSPPPSTGHGSTTTGANSFPQIRQGQLAPIHPSSHYPPLNLNLPRRSSSQQLAQQNQTSSEHSTNSSNSGRHGNSSGSSNVAESVPVRHSSSTETLGRGSSDVPRPGCFTSEYIKEGHGWSVSYRENYPIERDIDLLQTLKHSSVVCCVRFSPNGQFMATGCDRSVIVWNLRSGLRLSTLRDDTKQNKKNELYVRSVCFSPDSGLVASGAEDRIIRLWNYQASEVVQQFVGHEGHIYSLGCSPDGKYIASGSGDRTARIWDVITGACLHKLSPDNSGDREAGVTSVCFSPCSKLLATGSLDRLVRIYNSVTGAELDIFEGHSDSVYSVSFRPDGQQLASASLDKHVRLWELPNYFSNSPIKADIIESPGSEKVEAKDIIEGGMESSNSRTSNLKSSSSAPKNTGGSITKNEKSGNSEFFNPTLSNRCKVLVGHTDFVLSISYTNDGCHIVSGSKDRTVRIWDVATCETIITLTGHRNSVISVAVSEDGKYIATGSGDHRVRIWRFDQFHPNKAIYASNTRSSGSGTSSGSQSSSQRHLHACINNSNAQNYAPQGASRSQRQNSPKPSQHSAHRHLSPVRQQNHYTSQGSGRQAQNHYHKDPSDHYQRHKTGSRSPNEEVQKEQIDMLGVASGSINSLETVEKTLVLEHLAVSNESESAHQITPSTPPSATISVITIPTVTSSSPAALG